MENWKPYFANPHWTWIYKTSAWKQLKKDEARVLKELLLRADADYQVRAGGKKISEGCKYSKRTIARAIKGLKEKKALVCMQPYNGAINHYDLSMWKPEYIKPNDKNR